MKRREFIEWTAKGAIGATALGVVGCSTDCKNETGTDTSQQKDVAEDTTLPKDTVSGEDLQKDIEQDNALPEVKWEMATSWPATLDTLFGGAETVAQRLSVLTQGKFTITVHPAGELAAATEVLQKVSDGTVPIGHTCSYYYLGLGAFNAFGTALPFGLTARQQHAWLFSGGGLEMLQQIYADKFNVIQFPAGNSGAQMGGWFTREVSTVADLAGFKMRIGGLGAQVMAKLGVSVQTLGAGAIVQAFKDGTIDAAEWVGPYDDEKLGLNTVAKYYYYPGWWEPGATMDIEINLDEWKKLPELYQEALKTVTYQANMEVLARYDARNYEALERLLAGGTELRSFSDEILNAAYDAAFALYEENAQKEAEFKTIYDEWIKFRKSIVSWHSTNELAYMNFIAKKNQ